MWPLAQKDVTRRSKLLESRSYHGARFEAKALIIVATTMRGDWSVPCNNSYAKMKFVYRSP